MTTPKGASHNFPRAWPALRQGCDAPFSQARADAGSDRQRVISPSPFQGRSSPFEIPLSVSNSSSGPRSEGHFACSGRPASPGAVSITIAAANPISNAAMQTICRKAVLDPLVAHQFIKDDARVCASRRFGTPRCHGVRVRLPAH